MPPAVAQPVGAEILIPVIAQDDVGPVRVIEPDYAARPEVWKQSLKAIPVTAI